MSLDEAQKYAFKNSYLINNSRNEIEKAEKRLWEITAIGFPQAFISLDYQHSPNLPEQPVPAEFLEVSRGHFKQWHSEWPILHRQPADQSIAF